MRVEMADNRMTAWLSLDSPEEALRYASGDSLADALRAEGIKFGVDMPVVAKAVRLAAEAGEAIDRMVIATGLPATPSLGARHELQFDPEDFSAAGAEDVPILQILEHQVKHGKLLAKRLPPQKGTPGINVLGEMVKLGNGTDETLRASSGVTSVDSGRQLLAARQGIPATLGKMLKVDSTYTVEKNLDLAYGDVSFTGHVFIIGTIAAGVCLEAEQNAYIAGHVESGSVKAGGDILVHGGVTGNGDSEVTAGRTIRARYAQRARIQAEQDVFVQKSVLNSEIRAGGKVVVSGEKGQIAGGRIEAGHAIECQEAGTERGRQTILVLGERQDDSDDSPAQAVARLDKEIAGLTERLEPILARVSDVNALPSFQRQALKRCLERRQSLIALRDSKAAQVSSEPAAQPHRRREPSYLKVTGSIYPGVRVVMDGEQFEISKQIAGVLIYPKGGKIRTKALPSNQTKQNNHDHKP